jgi:hypothetical protein
MYDKVTIYSMSDYNFIFIWLVFKVSYYDRGSVNLTLSSSILYTLH